MILYLLRPMMFVGTCILLVLSPIPSKSQMNYEARGEIKVLTWPKRGIIHSDSLAMVGNLQDVRAVGIVGKSDLPLEVFQCANLESIEIVNSSIRTLPRQLLALKNLKAIRLFYCSGQRLRLKFNSTVTDLLLNNCSSKFIPKSFNKFSELRVLNLIDNKLPRTPKVRQNRKLENLHLQRNMLTRLEFRRLNRNIKLVSADNNRLKRLSISVRRMKSLESLSLGNNLISSISNSMINLKNLKFINLYNNHLSPVPRGIVAVPFLKDLDLTLNSITVLNDEFAASETLEMLHLSKNNLAVVPPNFRFLNALRVLDLSFNRIEGVPYFMASMKNLEKVDFSYNRITKIPYWAKPEWKFE